MAPKVDAHVLVYTLIFGVSTAAAIGLSKAYTKPQAELDAELRAKYPDIIKKSQDQKIHMQAFFDKMKDRNSKALDEDFAAIMKGGNGDIKRMQLYDKPKEVAPVAQMAPATVVDEVKKSNTADDVKKSDATSAVVPSAPTPAVVPSATTPQKSA